MLLCPHLHCAQPILGTAALQHLSPPQPTGSRPLCCVLSTPALIPRSHLALQAAKPQVLGGRWAAWHNQGWAAASLCPPGPTEHSERVPTATASAQSPLPSFMPPPCSECELTSPHTPCRFTQGLDRAQLLTFQLFLLILKGESTDTSTRCERGSSVAQEPLASPQHCCPHSTSAAPGSAAPTHRVPRGRDRAGAALVGTMAMQSRSCATGTDIPAASRSGWADLRGVLRARGRDPRAAGHGGDAEPRERPRGSGGSGAGGGGGGRGAAGGDELEEQEGEEMLGHRHNAALPAICCSARRGPGASAVSRARVPCRRPSPGADPARSRRCAAPSAPRHRPG